MKEQRYITVKNGGTRLMQEYTARCEKEGLPIVYARGTGKKYRFVEMDLIFVKNPHFFNGDTDFRARMIEAIEETTGRKYSGPALPGLYTAVKRVPVENAEPLMKAFLYIYDKMKHFAIEEEKK